MRLAAGIVAALVCAGLAAGASAGQSQYPTFFTKFKFEASTSSEEKFSGQIDSSKSKCIKDRKIVLYRKKNGDKSKIGDDKTNNKGKFTIGVGNGPPKDGKYYAEAKESSYTGDSGSKITCGDAKSGSVTIS